MFRRRVILAVLALLSFVVPTTAFTAEPLAKMVVPEEIQARCLAILKAGLASEQFWPAMHAAEGLSQNRQEEYVLSQFQDRLADEQDLRKRCGLARELVRAGDRRHVAELLAVLANSDPYGHVHACESLYKVGEIGDGKLLREAMSDKTAPVKSLMAAAALARKGDAAAYRVLRERLQPLDTEQGWVSAWILGVIGGAADIPLLEQGLNSVTTPRDRVYFGHALALLGNEQGREVLRSSLKSSDAVARADAAYMAGDANLVDIQSRLVELLEDPEIDVSIRAAQGLLTLARREQGGKETRKPIGPALRQPVVALALPPGESNSRNSEGDFIQLKDGRILFIYTHFSSGKGGDHDSAELRSRESSDGGATWSTADKFVARSSKGLNLMSVSLLRLQSGEIALFYLNKVSLTDCRPEMCVSRDEGATWSAPVACITDHVGYYVLNNSRAIQMKNGRLVLPVCLHWLQGTPKADWDGEIMCYFSDDLGESWKRSQSVQKAFAPDGKRITTQEPGIVELKDGRLMMLIRSSAGCQLIRYSSDGGNTWSEHELSEIKSPVSPASVKRIPATGDLLLVWNDHAGIAPELKGRRTPLTVAISRDEGRTWERVKNLFDDPNGWYCYIAIDFVGDTVLLGHCAGDRRKNGLAETRVTRFHLDWLYDR